MSQMTFQGAIRRLPACLQSGLDLVGQHKNAADLAFMAQTELDLAAEGDVEHTPREIAQIKNFLAMLKTEFGVTGFSV